MRIWLNGEERELAPGATLADAVVETGSAPDQRGIAAALEGEVVPRAQWRRTELGDGQHVEVVQAVQGG